MIKKKTFVLFAAACAMLFNVACQGENNGGCAGDVSTDTHVDNAAESKMLRLNVFISVADEQKRAEAIETARKLIEPSQKEEGCISYDMYESVTAPGEFIIVETWESQEALDRHMKQPHFIEYATKLDSYGKMHTDRYEF